MQDIVLAAGVAGGVGALVVGTFAATIAAIRSYERSKEPKVLSLAWVHEGLVEPAPFDRNLLIPPPLTAGGPTGAWPMILELRKDTPALPARQRFTFHPTIEGQVLSIEAAPDANAKPWLRGGTLAVATVSDRAVAAAARELVEAGGRR